MGWWNKLVRDKKISEWTPVEFTDEQLDKMLEKFSKAAPGSDEYWIYQLLVEKRYGRTDGST